MKHDLRFRGGKTLTVPLSGQGDASTDCHPSTSVLFVATYLLLPHSSGIRAMSVDEKAVKGTVTPPSATDSLGTPARSIDEQSEAKLLRKVDTQ